MSVTIETSAVSYSPGGATTVFAVPFYFLEADDLEVTLTTSGVEATLVLNTHYTVLGAGSEAGGSITMLTAPASGTTLTIKRAGDITQNQEFVDGDDFPAEAHEKGLDKLTMICQQLNYEIGVLRSQLESLSGSVATGLLLNFNGVPLTNVTEGPGFFSMGTLAAMKNIPTDSGNNTCFLHGVNAPRDLAGTPRWYVWDNSSTATGDDVSVVVPADSVGIGRWHQVA